MLRHNAYNDSIQYVFSAGALTWIGWYDRPEYGTRSSQPVESEPILTGRAISLIPQDPAPGGKAVEEALFSGDCGIAAESATTSDPR